jgi:subtilisin-like proprotein convertase family protein
MTTALRLAIVGIAAFLASATSAAQAQTPAPGDSNRDQQVSAPDLTELLLILAGAPATDGADANRDGFVLPDDADEIVSRIFGRSLVPPTNTPAATRTASATRTPTHTAGPPTPSPTDTVPPSASATATPTATGPAASATATRPASSPSATPTRTATSSGATATPTPSVTASATGPATATPTPTATSAAGNSPTPTATGSANRLYCAALPTPIHIPDDSPAGITSDIAIADAGEITDLNVRLRIAHQYVGDLSVALTHVDTETAVPLLQGSVCDQPDVDATFDDDAASFVENVCGPLPFTPALDGGIIPSGVLGDFTGEQITGTWRLAVADLEARDEGDLVEWCLEMNSTAPAVFDFNCGFDDCAFAIGEPFTLELSFLDPDANATRFAITAQDDAGATVDLVDDALDPGSQGGDTIQVDFSGFSCPGGGCSDTQFEFHVVVRDADGHESPFAQLPIFSFGSAAAAAPSESRAADIQPMCPLRPSRPGAPTRS